jgi:prevent-host-death family protein
MSTMPDIVPISDLRADAAGVIKRAATSQAPVFITQRGRAAAVMVSTQSYERSQHELEILRLLAAGEVEIEAGVGHSLDDVMAAADKLLAAP